MVTFVWLFTRVQGHVLFQNWLCTERLPTDVTCMWSLPSVSQGVPIKQVLAYKALIADLTLIGLGAMVFHHMVT